VDDFGVKYVGKEHADHLVASLKTKYKLVEDWAGDLYCGKYGSEAQAPLPIDTLRPLGEKEIKEIRLD
jgi:hypothetical protein